MRTFGTFAVVISILIMSGCGEEMSTTMAPTAKAVGDAAPAPATPSAARPVTVADRANFEASGRKHMAQAPGGGMGAMMAAYAPPSTPPADASAPADKTGAFASDETAKAAPEPINRMIVYNADVSLIVDNFARASEQIDELVKKIDGAFIAEMQLTGSPGAARSATWKVRIPSKPRTVFSDFVKEVLALGEIERNHLTSQDITDEFYDIEARMKNAHVKEDRLLQMVKETTGKLEELLRVETELSRVRGEIEQMQGRLNVLNNLASLTTVSITIRERDTFKPPPPAAASFPQRIQRTWEHSLEALEDLGKAVVLFAVDWVLWLPLLVVGAILAIMVLRLLVRLFVKYCWRA